MLLAVVILCLMLGLLLLLLLLLSSILHIFINIVLIVSVESLEGWRFLPTVVLLLFQVSFGQLGGLVISILLFDEDLCAALCLFFGHLEALLRSARRLHLRHQS